MRETIIENDSTKGNTMGMQRFARGMTNGGMAMARGDEPLTLDQIRARVPSVFAVEPHESRSDRFVAIPTVDVVRGLMGEGFEPFFAQQARTRVAGKAEYTRHMLRLRHRGVRNEAGNAFEVILQNANDGTAAYSMQAGFFRMVCANGHYTGDCYESVKVRHSGNAVDDVIEGAYRVLETRDRVENDVSAASGIYLTDRQQLALAAGVHRLRFPEEESAPFEPARLLESRRSEDRDNSLWVTMNRVQENAIRGGQTYTTRDANGRRRNGTTREVTGLAQKATLNAAIWELMNVLRDAIAPASV